jgi:guanine nucleotide-binding protein G(i) subunit alpha
MVALPPAPVYDERVGRAIAQLWRADDGVRAAHGARVRAGAPGADTAPYVLDKAAALGTRGYVPTVEDILRVRVRTAAVVEEEYWVDKALFHVADVGGQRTERRKWVHLFDGVSAVVFVASLADYDLVMEEDGVTNRLVDSLGLFAEVANGRWFERSSVILLLNKRDAFEAKLATTPLRHEGDKVTPPRFQDYDGGAKDVGEALKYLTGRFLELAADRRRPVHVHVTTATDSKAVRAVIRAIKREIVEDALRDGGLED